MENPSENLPLTSFVKAPNALALHESKTAKAKLDSLIAGCFLLQKLYGKQPENIEIINQLFHKLLGKYQADKAILAFELWLERSQEFPTPADIVNLIKRNGKPPLRESDIIAIRKKDGEYRTAAEWETLKEWDAQQQEGWREYADPVKDEAALQENIRLRQHIKDLEAENARAWTEAKSLRKPVETPKVSTNDQVINTLKFMKESGCPQVDIEAFCQQSGIYDQVQAV